MEEKTTVQTEDVVTEPAAQEATPETLNAFQKFMHQLIGKKDEEKPQEGAADPSKAKEPSAEQKSNADKGKTYTEDDIKASVEAEKKKWQDEQKEKERLAKLPPEERVKAEQDAKDTELAQLRSQLLQKELKDTAIADLTKDGFPASLASLIDYSSKESMEKSLETTKELFKASLSEAVNQKLKGKTPAGLGGAANAENAVKDQIAKNIRGGM